LFLRNLKADSIARTISAGELSASPSAAVGVELSTRGVSTTVVVSSTGRGSPLAVEVSPSSCWGESMAGVSMVSKGSVKRRAPSGLVTSVGSTKPSVLVSPPTTISVDSSVVEDSSPKPPLSMELSSVDVSSVVLLISV